MQADSLFSLFFSKCVRFLECALVSPLPVFCLSESFLVGSGFWGSRVFFFFFSAPSEGEGIPPRKSRFLAFSSLVSLSEAS